MIEVVIVGSQGHCSHSDADTAFETIYSAFAIYLSTVPFERIAASSRTSVSAAVALQKGAPQRLYISYFLELPLAAATGARTARSDSEDAEDGLDQHRGDVVEMSRVGNRSLEEAELASSLFKRQYERRLCR